MKTKRIMYLAVFFVLLCLYNDGKMVSAKELSIEWGSIISDVGMQCAAVQNGVEYKDSLYFVYDNDLYSIDSVAGEMEKVFSNVEDNFFIKGKYIYFHKFYDPDLYRVKIGKTQEQLVAKKVYKVIYIDNENMYYWGGQSESSTNKKLYRAKLDGTEVKCIFSNRGNSISLNEIDGSSSAYIFDGILFYSKSVKIESAEGIKYDHKIYGLNLETRAKKKYLSPKGITSSFYFYVLDGKLFAKSGVNVYKYNAKKNSFNLVKGDTLCGITFIGTDGNYLYGIDLIDELVQKSPEDTVIYRIGADWKCKELFTIEGLNLNFDYFTLENVSDGFYSFKRYIGDEYPVVICTDSTGKIVYERKPWVDVSKEKENTTDDLKISVMIYKGKAYSISSIMGTVCGAEIINL